MHDEQEDEYNNDVAWTCHCGCETLTTYQAETPVCHACGHHDDWGAIHEREGTVGPKALTGVSPYDMAN